MPSFWAMTDVSTTVQPDGVYSALAHIEHLGCTIGQVNDPTLSDWPAVVDTNNDGAVGLKIGDLDPGTEG